MTQPRKKRTTPVKPAAKKQPARPAAAQRARRVSLSSAGSQQSQTQRIASKRSSTVSTHVRTFQAALVAAAQAAVTPAGVTDHRPVAGDQAWHRAVYGYAKTVPELGAAKLYVGNCLAQIELKVGKRNPDGTVEPGYDGDAPVEGLDTKVAQYASEVVATMRSPYGGQAELLRSFGEKCFLAGDLYLLPEDSKTGLVHDALSTLELVPDDGGKEWKRHDRPGATGKPIPDGVIPVRVWRRDAEYSQLSTSSVQACIEVLEELVILTRLVRSAAIQRLALSGILAIADEFDDDVIEGDSEDGQTSEEMNPLAVDIIESGAKAIDDPASAASWLPYILQGPLASIKDGIKLIRFEGDDALNVVKRGEAIGRLAHGIDLPAEAVLGYMATTFTNSLQISEDRFKVHIEPMVQLLVEALTLEVLWPGVAKKMGVKPETVQQSGYPPEVMTVAVWADPSNLIAVPDRSKDVIEAFKADRSQTAVKIAELRDAIGLDPDIEVDADETARRLNAIRIQNMRETIQAQGDPSASIVADVEAEAAAAGQGGTSDAPATGAPGPSIDASGVAAAAALALAVAERIAGASEITIERAASRVGAILRTRANERQREQMSGRSNQDVARVLGPAVAKKLLKSDNPAEAEVAELTRQVTRWAAELGVENPGRLAVEVSEAVAEAITERLYGTSEPKMRAESLLQMVARSQRRSDAA